jgi:hypothetical protein
MRGMEKCQVIGGSKQQSEALQLKRGRMDALQCLFARGLVTYLNVEEANKIMRKIQE